MAEHTGTAFREGAHLPVEDLSISVPDPAFCRSDVVFDVDSVFDRAFFRLDGRTIGNGAPGITASQLRALYWRKRAQGWYATDVADLLELSLARRAIAE